MLVMIQILSDLLLILLDVVVGCSLVVMTHSYFAHSLRSLVTIDTIRLLTFVWESKKAHRSFCGAAVLAGPGDGVTDTSISQPASIAAIVTLKLPSSVHVAHLGDLCTIVYASLHSLVKGQPVGLDQPIELS